MIIHKIFLTAAVITSAAVQAEDWPRFRGPGGDGVSAATSVPVAWAASENVAWKQPVPGAGWSSPVLAGGKLYLTTAVEGENDAVSLRAMCVNANDGATVWDVEVFRPEQAAAQEKHTKNSIASPTPIIDGDRLYVHFGHLGTAALDRSGRVIWRQTGLSYLPRHGNGGSPVLVDGLLVFSCDGREDPFVAALDAKSGDVKWKTERNTDALKKFSFSTPVVIDVDGQKQVVSPGSGFVAAYGSQNGHEIWRVRYGEGYSVVPCPVYSHGLLFVASGFEKPTLLAIDPKGAQGDVTETNVVWKHEKGAPLTASVLAVGDELYFVSDNGVATCVDAKTGKVHWTKRLGGDFSASPVFAEGRIYFQNEAGVTTVVQAAKEFESLATNDLGERTLASAVPTDGALILRSESNLWRIQSDAPGAAGN